MPDAMLADYGKASSVIRQSIQRDVEAYCKTIDFSDPGWGQEAEAFVRALADKYGEAAATIQADLFEELAGMPAEMATESVEDPSVSWAVYGSTSRDELISRVAKVVGMSAVWSREATMQASARKHHVRWALVPVGDTCNFCIMRASRGFDYSSKRAAKRGHDDCNCIPVPDTHAGRGAADAVGYDEEALYNQYLDGRKAVGDSTDPKKILAGMREANGGN